MSYGLKRILRELRSTLSRSLTDPYVLAPQRGGPLCCCTGPSQMRENIKEMIVEATAESQGQGATRPSAYVGNVCC